MSAAAERSALSVVGNRLKPANEPLPPTIGAAQRAESKSTASAARG